MESTAGGRQRRIPQFLAIGPGPDGAVRCSCCLEAARLVREAKPDLVLMDMILPGLDGLGVLDQIAAMDEDKPEVIILSQFVSSKVMSAAMSRGVYYYMPKPCEIDSLIERMKQAMAPENAAPVKLEERQWLTQ